MSQLIIPGATPGVQPGNSVSLKDLLPHTDATQAREFLETLHGRSQGYVTLTLMPRGRVRGGVRTGSDTWPGVRTELGDDPSWWHFCEDSWPRFDAYTMVGALRQPPKPPSRGQGKDVISLPGVFADLDVKSDLEGAFKTRAELDAFLAKLPPTTMQVNTGSGGCHAYWLLDEPATEPTVMGNLLDGWWDYLTHHASTMGNLVDHVQERARVLRVAGTVRWSRVSEKTDSIWAPVTLVHADGPRYTAGELLELSEPWRTAAVEHHEAHKSEWRVARDAQVNWLSSLGLAHAAQEMLAQRFNETEDWQVLLEQAGWRLHSDRRDGSKSTTDCRYWTRPGKEVGEGKSACTDHWKNPTVMYVYTADPYIAPCIIPTSDRFKKVTSKYRFALHFLFDGDEARLLESIIKGKGRLA